MPLDDFKNTIDRLAAFDFGQELQTIVEDNVEKIVPMIWDQLAAGKAGDGKDNTVFGHDAYAIQTVREKEEHGKGLGAITDRITNFMTGDFYESLRIQVEGRVFEADSDVPYFADIKAYSRDALLEVDEEHRLEFAEEITIPAITEALNAKTGLQITSV